MGRPINSFRLSLLTQCISSCLDPDEAEPTTVNRGQYVHSYRRLFSNKIPNFPGILLPMHMLLIYKECDNIFTKMLNINYRHQHCNLILKLVKIQTQQTSKVICPCVGLPVCLEPELLFRLPSSLIPHTESVGCPSEPPSQLCSNIYSCTE